MWRRVVGLVFGLGLALQTSAQTVCPITAQSETACSLTALSETPTSGCVCTTVAEGPFGGHATLANGLVSYWRLDEESGTRVDVHGSNDLTDNNTVGFAAGKSGNAASFVAANSESLTSTTAWDTTSTWSRVFWFYQSAAGAGFAAMFGTEDSGGAGTMVYADYGVAGTVGAVGNPGPAVTFAGVATGQWHQIYVEYDGSKLGAALDGGALSQSTTFTYVPCTGANKTTAGKSTGGAYYNGLLDEMAIYSRVLTSQERADLWNSGNGLFY